MMSEISSWRVLLIDDEPDSLKLLHDILAHGGATVFEAANGQEFFDLLKTVDPTVIVVDLSMPKPDGWDLLAEVRAEPNWAFVPVIAVTAFYSEKVTRDAATAGFAALLPKPIRYKTFLSTIQDVLTAK
jgi:two-component system CheB/CheR fusion protein